MTFNVTVNELTEQQLRELTFFLTGGMKNSSKVKEPKEEKPIEPKKTSKKTTKKVEEVDEEEEDEEVDFDADEDEEEVEDEDDSEDEESDEEVEDDEDEEEEEAPAKKKKTSSASAGKSANASKIKLQDVMTEFQAAQKRLAKKLKSEEKASAKLNALLKKHSAKSIRTLDAAKYSTVMKELKAL